MLNVRKHVRTTVNSFLSTRWFPSMSNMLKAMRKPDCGSVTMNGIMYSTGVQRQSSCTVQTSDVQRQSSYTVPTYSVCRVIQYRRTASVKLYSTDVQRQSSYTAPTYSVCQAIQY